METHSKTGAVRAGVENVERSIQSILLSRTCFFIIFLNMNLWHNCIKIAIIPALFLIITKKNVYHYWSILRSRYLNKVIFIFKNTILRVPEKFLNHFFLVNSVVYYCLVIMTCDVFDQYFENFLLN